MDITYVYGIVLKELLAFKNVHISLAYICLVRRDRGTPTQ